MSSSIKSALWMLLASLNFVILNSLVKYLSINYDLFQIIFFRSFFAVVFLIPLVLKDGIQTLKTKSIKLQVLRSLVAVGAMYLWFYSISNIELSKATAINFTAPIFGAIFAVLFLKEKLRKRRFLAILASFFGALIIIKPGFIYFDTELFFVIFASILMGLAAVFIKKLSMLDHSNAVVLYMPLTLTFISLIPCLINWNMPNKLDFFFLIMTGLVAILAHISVTKALALSEANYVLIFEYFRLPLTAILAFYIFSETTNISTWIGGLMIFLSSTYIIHRERKSGAKDSVTVMVKKIN